MRKDAEERPLLPSRAIRGAGIGSINFFRSGFTLKESGFTLKELGAQGPPGRYSSHQPTPAGRITASYGVVPVANLGLTRSWATHYTTRLNPVSVEWFRRVAGCATPTGSAGHAGATANLKLTFHLDHSAADQPIRAHCEQPPDPGGWCSLMMNM